MNLGRWIGLSDDQRQAYHDRLVTDVRRSMATGQMVTLTPGARLQAEGVDQEPTVVRDDETSQAVVRLLVLHGFRRGD